MFINSFKNTTATSAPTALEVLAKHETSVSSPTPELLSDQSDRDSTSSEG